MHNLYLYNRCTNYSSTCPICTNAYKFYSKTHLICTTNYSNTCLTCTIRVTNYSKTRLICTTAVQIKATLVLFVQPLYNLQRHLSYLYIQLLYKLQRHSSYLHNRGIVQVTATLVLFVQLLCKLQQHLSYLCNLSIARPGNRSEPKDKIT